MAIQFPSLIVPPRPPELPSVPPPPGHGETFLRNDAYLSQWIDQFHRIVKDAWSSLATLVRVVDTRVTDVEGRTGTLEERATALEDRVADTYTFGHKGALRVAPDPDPNWIALPLRVVRDEELLEMVASLETSGDGASFSVKHNGDEVAVLTVASGPGFAVVPLDPPRPLLVNDQLLVQVVSVGTNTANAVIQLRCR